MTLKRVLVLGDLPGDGVSRLRRHCEVSVRSGATLSEEELARLVPGYHGLLTLLTQPVGERVLAAGGQLQIVANCAVGFDNIDLQAASRHEVVVTHTPDVLTEDTADLTWALILAVLRGVVSADRFLRRLVGLGDVLHLGLLLVIARTREQRQRQRGDEQETNMAQV